MSALTDLFTAMANKIRTKTGTQTTYTPSEMVSDGIDDVYDAGVASATTPITPSNASPAGMTANVGYKPTANGYAISSYNNVTPSNSSPVALTSGDIDKMGGNGYAISSYIDINSSDTDPTQLFYGSIYRMLGNIGYAIKSYPSLVSPSNSSPAALTYGKIYRINATDGYAIKSYTPVTPSSTPTSVANGAIVRMDGSGVIVDSIPTPTSITPSDSNPVALTADTPVNPTTNGYAIASQPSNKTPDDTTPPSVTSGEIVKMGGAGYLYATQQAQSDLFTLLSALSGSSKITVSNSTSISVTSGKHYLVVALGIYLNASPTTTFSGGTVEWETSLVNSGAANSRYAIAKMFLVTATSDSISFTITNSSANRGYIALQLD